MNRTSKFDEGSIPYTFIGIMFLPCLCLLGVYFLARTDTISTLGRLSIFVFQLALGYAGSRAGQLKFSFCEHRLAFLSGLIIGASSGGMSVFFCLYFNLGYLLATFLALLISTATFLLANINLAPKVKHSDLETTVVVLGLFIALSPQIAYLHKILMTGFDSFSVVMLLTTASLCFALASKLKLLGGKKTG